MKGSFINSVLNDIIKEYYSCLIQEPYIDSLTVPHLKFDILYSTKKLKQNKMGRSVFSLLQLVLAKMFPPKIVDTSEST